MRKLGLCLFFILLCSPHISHGTEEDGWTALPLGRPFGVIPSDPRDLKLALRGNNKSEIDADVGGYKSVAGWSGDGLVFHTGIEGGAFFQMRKEGTNFPLHSSDGLIGVYGEAAKGEWAYQLRFTHISAHLSDGLTPVRQRFLYTREYFALRVAKQFDWFRAYVGYQFLVNTKPVMPRSSLQIGGYAILPMHWGIVHPYFGGDLRVRSSQEGTTFQLSAGAALVSPHGAAPLRFTASYMKGHDPRGQFYFEKTEKWSFGMDLDI